MDPNTDPLNPRRPQPGVDGPQAPNDIQNPNQYFSQPFQAPNQGPAPSYGSQPSLQPQAASGANPQYPLKKGPNKLVIIIIAGITLLAVLGIVAALAGSGQKPKPAQPQQTDVTQSQSLQPAQAIDLEQTSNAISQDLSSLDDERDFPAASLEDKTLGL